VLKAQRNYFQIIIKQQNETGLGWMRKTRHNYAKNLFTGRRNYIEFVDILMIFTEYCQWFLFNVGNRTLYEG